MASSRTDQNSAISDLFQEAELSEAIIFFDECEAVFNQRGTVLNSLLTSIERFRGLVFLATNKPLDIDEAMHRRISKVYYFLPPNYQQRSRLWDTFKKTGLSFQEGIDWASISLKHVPPPAALSHCECRVLIIARYELTGGFIKNAIMSALMQACARDIESPVISQDDVVQGCSMQMRGYLQMKATDFVGSIIPKKGLADIVLEASSHRVE